MIHLNRETVNTIYATLTEKTTINPVFYIFKFTNENTDKSIEFLSAELSTNITRYNKFNVTTTDTLLNQDVDNGIIYLTEEGQYSYVVFEATADDIIAWTGTTTTLATVETGKVFLSSTTGWNPGDTINDTYTNTTPDKIAYQG